jgi:hypothetical protein
VGSQWRHGEYLGTVIGSGRHNVLLTAAEQRRDHCEHDHKSIIPLHILKGTFRISGEDEANYVFVFSREEYISNHKFGGEKVKPSSKENSQETENCPKNQRSPPRLHQ